jgi:uncharacterized surface protein with fasciclin (FAS1) repeats
MLKKLIAAGAVAALAGVTFAGTAAARSPVVPPPKASADIVTLAVDNGNFTTLVAAVGCADPAVLAALTSGEQYTVFAPTDAAFQTTLGVDASTVCTIDQALLTNVLLYHVTEGRRFSNSVLPKGMAPPRVINTLLGVPFTVSRTGEITDGNSNTSPTIVVADIPATNGVIHVVDEVLLPIEL